LHPAGAAEVKAVSAMTEKPPEKEASLFQRALIVTAALVAVAGVASPAGAQGFGIGPRVSFVHGDGSNAPSNRFVGGTVRLRGTGSIALEGAMDYRSYAVGDDGLERVREVPIQASALLFLSRSSIAPYVVGGIGRYARMTDTLDDTGKVASTTTENRVGWHLGLGVELLLTRHTAFFTDYRYRFVRFGTPQVGAEPINIPGLHRLSHEGSMWTSGLAFYF
jgi:hypothetical protein